MPKAVKPLALLTAAVLAYYWKILFTRQFSLLPDSETVSQAYSWFRFWTATVRAGHWPIWDPYMFGGRSFAGEMQTAAFYPLHLVFLLFPAGPGGLFSPALFHIYFAAVHVLAAFAMYALAREFRLSPFAGVLAGLTFSLGGFMGQVPWFHLLESAAWTPLLLLFSLRAFRAESLRRLLTQSALAGLCFGLSLLAGGLHIAMMQAILLAAAAVAALLSKDRPGSAARPIAALLLALAIGALAGAAQLAASLEYSPHALRFVIGGPLPATQKIPYANLTEYASPRILANYLFYGNPQGTMNGVEALDPYTGVLPLLLAIIGWWKRRDSVWVRWSAVLAILGFLFSLGHTSVIHGVLYALVPYLWMAREASRFLFLTHFAIAVAAAFGAQVLFYDRQPFAVWKPLHRALLLLAVAALGALAAPAVFGIPPLPWYGETSLLMIVLTYPVFLWIARGSTGPLPKLTAAALIVFNLAAFDLVSRNRQEAARNGGDQLERLRSFSGAVAFLRRQPAPFRVRVLADPPLNIGDAYSIETLNGGAVTLAANFLDLINRTTIAPRLLNTRYLIRPASAGEANPVYADAAWKIYLDPEAAPRAWVVHRAAAEASRQRTLELLNASAFNPLNLAYTAEPLAQPPVPSAGPDTVTLTRQDATHLQWDAQLASRGLLVTAELVYPGWQARIDGTPARIYEADAGLRSVVVPEGHHAVTLVYRPVAVWAGLVLSFVTFAGTLALFFAARSRPS